jgi:hypothetical protein
MSVAIAEARLPNSGGHAQPGPGDMGQEIPVLAGTIAPDRGDVSTSVEVHYATGTFRDVVIASGRSIPGGAITAEESRWAEARPRAGHAGSDRERGSIDQAWLPLRSCDEKSKTAHRRAPPICFDPNKRCHKSRITPSAATPD